MRRVRRRHAENLCHALVVLGLSLVLLPCALLASVALALEAHACQGTVELPTLCSKSFGSKEFSPGLVLEPGSPALARLTLDGPIPVGAWSPGTLCPTFAWSVRAPPSID